MRKKLEKVISSFRIQKIHNSKPLNDGGWREYYDPLEVSHPYGWSDGNEFGVVGFSKPTSGNYIVVAAGTGNLYSSYFNLQNDDAIEYTVIVTARSVSGTFSTNIKVLNYNNAGTVVQTHTKSINLTTDWTDFSWTLSGNTGADMVLPASAVGGAIQLLKNASNGYYIKDIKVLGEVTTFGDGFFVPFDENESPIQEVVENAAGDIRGKTSWNVPVKSFGLDIRKWLKEDYQKLYDFLNSVDVGWGRHNCIFTDDNAVEHCGCFKMKNIKLTAQAFQSVMTNLSFVCLPY